MHISQLFRNTKNPRNTQIQIKGSVCGISRNTSGAYFSTVFLEIQKPKHKGGLCGGVGRVTADKEVTTADALTGMYYNLKS